MPNVLLYILSKYSNRPLEDDEYQKGLEKYGEKISEITNPTWKKDYLNIED